MNQTYLLSKLVQLLLSNSFAAQLKRHSFSSDDCRALWNGRHGESRTRSGVEFTLLPLLLDNLWHQRLLEFKTNL